MGKKVKIKSGDRVFRKSKPGFLGTVDFAGTNRCIVEWDNDDSGMERTADLQIAEKAKPNEEWLKIWEESASDD